MFAYITDFFLRNEHRVKCHLEKRTYFQFERINRDGRENNLQYFLISKPNINLIKILSIYKIFDSMCSIYSLLIRERLRKG